MKSLQVGLVGCGRWGKHILRDLNSLNCQTWVVANTENSRKNAQKAHKIVRSINDLPQDLDGYVVAVPTVSHALVIQALLPRQRPIFTEKPLTEDAQIARELANAAPEHLFVMEKWRYHPGIEALRAIVDSQELGAVEALHIKRLGWGHPHQDVDPIWILLPHDLSIALHLLGDMPQPQQALLEHSGTEVSGLWAELAWQNIPVWIEISAKRLHRERSVQIQFEKGIAAMLDPFADHILLHTANMHDMHKVHDVEQRSVSTEFPLLRELRAFVEYLQGGNPPLSSAHEGALNVETIARLRQMAGLKF